MTLRVRRLRRDTTEAERVLWHELRLGRLGWRFRRQHTIPPYIVDFACLEARLVVEADGGQHALAGEHELRDEELRRKRFAHSPFLEQRHSREPERSYRDDRCCAGVRTLAPALTRPRKPPP